MEIIASNKGSEKLCLDGFMYTLNCIRKNKIWWKCVERARSNSGPHCNASISTDRKIKNPEMGKPHNHDPDETKIHLAKLRNLMRERAMTTGDNPTEIYNLGLSQFDETVRRRLPSEEVCRRAIRRYRTSSSLPVQRTRIQDLLEEIPKDFTFQTLKEEDATDTTDLSNMVRTYIRKTSHGLYTSDVIIKAVDQVLLESRSLRSAAAEAKIPFNTLKRYVQKRKQGQIMTVGYSRTRQVFTDKQEEELEKYILTASNIYFGLSTKEIRILAFQCARRFLIETPKSWESKGCAGSDWFSSFVKRHPNLSKRVPEPISLARATSFDQTNVAQFFTEFGDVIDPYKFEAAAAPVTSGEIVSPNSQSVNYGSSPNGVGSANEQVTYVSDSSSPAYIDQQDVVSNHLNNLPTADLGFLQLQQQQQQQQLSTQQTKPSLSLKPSPPQSPAQHQLNAMGFPELPRGMYITRNLSPERLPEPSGSDNFPVSQSHIQDSNNYLRTMKKPEEELSETDRTRDSGVISTDDCDNIESKEAIAAQIVMMQSSSFTNSELTDASQTVVGNHSRIGNHVLSNLNELATAAAENKADGETDSIAEYFKICDNNTRQTFLDVMRNDREQHLSALDKINAELKTVKVQMQQTKTEHILKEQQLQEVMKQMNQLQMEVLTLHTRNTELSEREKTLQRKMKTYTKKVSLCDSALNAMSNER